VTPGIPKLRKESHPERAKDNEDHFFTPSEPYPREPTAIDKPGDHYYDGIIFSRKKRRVIEV